MNLEWELVEGGNAWRASSDTHEYYIEMHYFWITDKATGRRSKFIGGGDTGPKAFCQRHCDETVAKQLAEME